MALETWWLYLGAVVLIACTPGPNVLYVTTRSIRFGLGPASIGMTGCLVALVLMLTGSVAGLSALLLALPTAFDVLKIAGAAYLVYLGIQLWREPVEPGRAPVPTGRRRRRCFAMASWSASAIPSCRSSRQPSFRSSSSP